MQLKRVLVSFSKQHLGFWLWPLSLLPISLNPLNLSTLYNAHQQNVGGFSSCIKGPAEKSRSHAWYFPSPNPLL